MSDNLTIAQRIKIARVEAGLSQKDLAALAGIAQPNLSRYEKGSSSPTAETVDKLFAAIMSHMPNGSVTLNAVDGVLGVRGRTAGRLEVVDLNDDPEPIDHIASLGGCAFLARGYTTIIAGQSGAGKSNLTQTLGAALANGDDTACGMILPAKPQRVLFIDAENGKNLILDRAKNMLALQEEAYEYFVVASAKGFDLRYDMDALAGILEDAVTEGKPYDAVVIDSMMTTWFGNVNQADQVRDYLQGMNALAAKHNVGVLIIHHTGKGGEFFGSFAIEANVSGALYELLREGEEGPVRRLRPSKVRITAEPAPTFLFVTQHGIGTEPDGEE